MSSIVNASNWLGKWRKGNGMLLHAIAYTVLINGGQGESNKHWCQATIKINLNGDELSTEFNGSEGVGPVDALAKALQKVLTKSFPEIANWNLADLRVKVINSVEGTASDTTVFIKATNGKNFWKTSATSKDMIEASYLALLDSFEYFILKYLKFKKI